MTCPGSLRLIALLVLSCAFLIMPAAAQVRKRPLPPIDAYNYVLGTQTIGASYQFTNEPRLVETARAILGMGSHVIKFALAPDKSDTLKPKNLTEVARDAPEVKAALTMPFTDYVLWAYPISAEAGRFQPQSLPGEYREMYDLTCYLLTAYNGTGKSFYLGNWEGDWHLTRMNPNAVPTPEQVQNMIAWANMRQKAVDDAKRDTPHKDVQVYYYLEVNRVVDAMQGKVRLTNDVLPKTNVDFVSYSSYDSLGGDTEANLKKALDYIQSQLPPKPGLPGKRVFIGEYGFPAISHSPQEQDALSRRVMRAGLAWGCPFVLYWEMYNNEVDKDGNQRGFWLIDDHNLKQPVYFTHQRFYEQARQYVTDFQRQHLRLPTREEFGAAAISWLADAPATPAQQTLAVPSILSDNMVLQQQKPIRLWGKAAPGRTVSVVLQRESDATPFRQGKATVSADGDWTVTLPAMDASFTPYRIAVTDGAAHLTISSVLVGEVWLAGGQSNMQLAVSYILGADQILAQAHNPYIRFFCQDHIPKTFSQGPAWDVSGGAWLQGSAEDDLRKAQVSGIGYVFAQTLFQALNTGERHVPVAVLDTATGATSIQAWLSPDKIKNSPPLAVRNPKVWYHGGDWAKAYNQATVEYNAKVAPLIPLSIRGFLWYQGENDVGGDDAATYYRAAQQALIQDWRVQFHAPETPFLAVQIAPHVYWDDLSTVARMREAQIEACAAEPKAVALPIHDVPLTWNEGPFGYKNPIHPLDKAPVGQRLARAALALAYDMPVEYEGPNYTRMKVTGDTVNLRFTHADMGLKIGQGGKALKGFTVCGADRIFFPAHAVIDGSTVAVRSTQVPHPVAAAYGYTSMNQDANLFNGAGLPADPFRTDKVASHYFDPQPWMGCDTNTQWVDDGKTAGAQPCWRSVSGNAHLSIETTVLRLDYAADGQPVSFQPVLPHKLDIRPYGGLQLHIYNPDQEQMSLHLQLTDDAGKAVNLPTAILPSGPKWAAVAFRFAQTDIGEITGMTFTLTSPVQTNPNYLLLDDIQFIGQQRLQDATL